MHSSELTEVGKSLRVRTLRDVVDWGLCVGCGACKYASTKGTVQLVNIESLGIRPAFDRKAEVASSELLDICPGYSVDAGVTTKAVSKPTDAERDFGPALEMWEGHAADPELRYRGSSGGILSALALYCLEREEMGFVLHAGMDPDRPWLNKTVTSRTRAQLLSRAGSRYAPSSPCEGLGEIEKSDRPCVFIGKPCDTAAVMKARVNRPDLDERLGLVLTFFCAGTPSTSGTLKLLDRLRIEPETVHHLAYRGEGWPGGFTVMSGQDNQRNFIPYDQAWGSLTPYVPLRCRICPDGLGRVADISCGDAWEKYDGSGSNPGMSIVLVRSQRGQKILRAAMAAGYVNLVPITSDTVLAAQPHLLSRRRELFGRLLALRLLLVPIPRFYGFSQFHSWIRLPLLRKIRTIAGTLRRAVVRCWWKRRHIDPDLMASLSRKPLIETEPSLEKCARS